MTQTPQSTWSLPTGIIAILQALGLFGLPRLLGTYYAPFGHADAFESRGGATAALCRCGDIERAAEPLTRQTWPPICHRTSNGSASR